MACIGGCCTSGAINWSRLTTAKRPPENSKERELRLQVGQLKRLVADKTLEADFFKGALQKVEARRQSNTQAWRDGIYDQVRELMSMQGNLSIERMCQLAGVSRAGFYRSLQEREPVEEDMEVRSAIQNDLRRTQAALWIPARQQRAEAARDAGES